jgi:hypothetical protein
MVESANDSKVREGANPKAGYEREPSVSVRLIRLWRAISPTLLSVPQEDHIFLPTFAA